MLGCFNFVIIFALANSPENEENQPSVETVSRECAMPLVRLQCPACASIVKISDEIAAQHPLVRCARCQGLVTVATSRVIEPVASADDGDDYSYKPKKKKKRSRGSAAPIGMIVGIIVGLLVLVGVGIGIYFLIDHFGGSSLEKQFKRALAQMQKMADALDAIKTPQDVPKAFDQMKDVITDLQKIDEDNRKNGINPNGEEFKKVAEKYMPEVLKLTARMQGSMMTLAMNPEMARAVQENVVKFSASVNQLAFMGGGFNPTNRNAPPDFGNNPFNDPSAKLGSSPPTNIPQHQLENALKSKGLQARVLPPMLNEIRDNDTAELALGKMEAILQSLNLYDRKIRQFEQDGGSLATAAAQSSLQEIEKTTNELAVHLARIEKLPDLGSMHDKIVRKLSDVGLAATAGSTASNRPTPGKDTGNPFEPSTPGVTSSKTDGGNPFEPAGSRGTAGTPGKTEGGNPFETVPSSGKSGSMDGLIAKLTSNEHFQKLDGLKEAQSAKVEEGSKAAVLEALLKLCDDNDFHQKVEVLKAYKKWATTIEDKEKLGEHAEALLKDHWAKKDTLRYFGENKVISASKEVAYLLKDNFERKDAAETLIAMGSEAEKSVIPHLTDLEPQVRQMAIEVLARIGTPACIPDLQKLKTDRFVGRAASQAITLINSRKK